MDAGEVLRRLGLGAIGPDAGVGRDAQRRLARRIRRRLSVWTVRAARRWKRRLKPHVPVLGGASLLGTIVLSGLWTTGVLPGTGPGIGRDLAPERRVCTTEARSLPVADREVRFDGAFADRPPSGDTRVEAWVRILEEEHGDYFHRYLARAARYETWIRPELARHGVPEDFLYLAVIESGVNPVAHSRMGAVGPWQFVHLTAREQGLRISWSVDERRDPAASTGAAARYLARLRWAFGSWELAAAAYNAGPRRVGRALRVCGCDTFWELVETRILADETRDFVPKLIAAARIGADPLGHGMGRFPRPVPLAYREVRVEPTSRLDAVARAAGTSLEEVRRLNPHLVRDLTPPRAPSLVRLPPHAVSGFRAAWRTIPEEERRAGSIHVVQRRETLSGIARSYGVSLRALRAANDRLDPRRLRPGQRLRVPAGTL